MFRPVFNACRVRLSQSLRKYWTIRSGKTNRLSFLCDKLVRVTEERPALRVAQDHPLDANVLELGGAATSIQPIDPKEGKRWVHLISPVKAPDSLK